ncbi:LIM domain only protein 7-like isoform X5 [Hemiscyllium ocellatum]|uniref:LIM domain only protein 7-like isoform X5 n=1 Tax=Hemiscyllium ocellatum TaxID=170820 RepID=UPI002965D867|nr:LIM domain only protein 7-like isoform X5 [Hemiscyllium ocellatum]
MEWKQQADPDHVLAFRDAQRWIEEVTGKSFGNKDFRSALEDGALLCELVNKIKPGVSKKINRLSTPIAGLDNINVFLKGCQKLGLKEAQLFHPGDLQDLSSRVTVKREENQRRLKNVLITIYWLGRRAQHEPHYNGPYLNLKAFEGLLGQTLTKALVDSGSLKRSGRDSGYCDIWCTERNESISPQHRHRRDDSLDSLDSFGSKSVTSLSSDITLKGSSEGGGSDVESDYLNSKTMDEVKNDMSLRRTSTSDYKPVLPYNQFLPKKSKPATYIPAPLMKRRAERHEENRRSWANPMFEKNDGTFSRLLQRSADSDLGSKSLNDVSEDSAGIPKSLRYEELQRIKATLNDQDQQWQSDLAKWKNRRKSYTSDLQRKKDEREEIEKITSGESAKPTKTFRQIRKERELRQEGSYAGDQTDYRKLNSSDEEVFAEETKPPRRFYERSSTVASETPFTSQRHVVVSSAPPPQASKSTTASELKSSVNNLSGKQSSAALYTRHVMDPKTEQTKVSNSLPRNYQAPDVSRIAPVIVPRPYGTQSKRVSSLSRSYQLQDESLKYNGDVNGSKTSQGTPSFFSKPEAQESKNSRGVLPKEEEGTTWANSSLKMEEKRSVLVNLSSKPENDVHAKSNRLAKQDDDDQSQASPVMSSNEDEAEEEEEEEEEERAASLSKSNFPQESEPDTTTGPVTMNSFTKTSSLATAPVTTAATQQGHYSNSRIVINQRPNSGRDFGFTTIPSSTGITVESVEQGGPAEFCQLQEGDEIISINGNDVAGMSHQTWQRAMEDSSKSGNLNLEIRRYEKSYISDSEHTNFNDPTRWEDAGLASVTNRTQFLNRSMEVDKSKRDQENLMEDAKPKASEPLSLRNFKRRSQFFEQGGSESAVSDLQIPSISVSSRWSWNPEEERKRQEVWQKEQERLLQEKYQREQEKLREEWRKAQQEAEQEGTKYYEEERRILQETNTPQSPSDTVDGPVGFKNQFTSRNWMTSWNNQESEDESQELREEEVWHGSEDDEAGQREEFQLQEERRHQEEEEEADRLEQERKLQEKERERQEQWHREKERLEEKRQKQRQQAEERARLAESERTEEYQPQWAKSKSTSDLDEFVPAHGHGDVKHKVPDNSWIKSEMKPKSSQQQDPPHSYAEQERQKILQEMRRKTQLLNDNSWIRQRSVANKTASSNYGLMRRGESLDNLDAPKTNNWGTNAEPTHSSGKGPGFYPISTSNRSYMRTASSTLPPQSTGSLRTASWTKNPSVEPTSQSQILQSNRSISGKKICSYCDNPLGRGAAMIIESLGLCYHLQCFKCILCSIDLGGTESGAEVRVRNNKLYCNACYIQYKAGQSVPI